MKVKLKLNPNLSLVKLDKKLRFLLYSLLVSLFVFLFAFGGSKEFQAFYIFLALSFSVLGVFIIQFPYVTLRNFLTHSLMPLHLTAGVVGSLYYFPNLSVYLKIALVLVFSVSLYTTSLINNIFSVVSERQESIPLYRAALTWMQIILVSLSIPFFATVFKINTNSIIQNAFAAISSVSLVFYLIWAYRFDDSHKKFVKGERAGLILFTFVFVFFGGLAVSFIPTESFLRAIFVSSILLFCLSYISETLKNNVTMSLIVQHLIICSVFLGILLIFNP